VTFPRTSCAPKVLSPLRASPPSRLFHEPATDEGECLLRGPNEQLDGRAIATGLNAWTPVAFPGCSERQVVGCSGRAAYQGDVIRGDRAVRVIVSRVTQYRRNALVDCGCIVCGCASVGSAGLDLPIESRPGRPFHFPGHIPKGG
jgi:hypothetical protein